MFITTNLYNSNNILANINKWDLFCFYFYTKTKIIVGKENDNDIYIKYYYIVIQDTINIIDFSISSEIIIKGKNKNSNFNKKLKDIIKLYNISKDNIFNLEDITNENNPYKSIYKKVIIKNKYDEYILNNAFDIFETLKNDNKDNIKKKKNENLYFTCVINNFLKDISFFFMPEDKKALNISKKEDKIHITSNVVYTLIILPLFERKELQILFTYTNSNKDGKRKTQKIFDTKYPFSEKGYLVKDMYLIINRIKKEVKQSKNNTLLIDNNINNEYKIENNLKAETFNMKKIKEDDIAKQDINIEETLLFVKKYIEGTFI